MGFDYSGTVAPGPAPARTATGRKPDTPDRTHERAMPDAHPKTASPWVIDTRAIGLAKHAGPGHAHRLDVRGPAPEQTISGVLEVPATAEVTVSGLLESVAEGVLVSGEATAVAAGTCSRCLTEIEVPIVATFRELFAYPDSVTAETTDPDEVPRLVDDLADLTALIHDELVLAMPTIPVCRPDCPGLCPVCGERLDRVDPDHRHETIDPRWAALAGLVVPEPAAGADGSAGVTNDDPAGHSGGNDSGGVGRANETKEN